VRDVGNNLVTMHANVTQLDLCSGVQLHSNLLCYVRNPEELHFMGT